MTSRIAKARRDYRVAHFGLGGTRRTVTAVIPSGRVFSILGEKLTRIAYVTPRFGDGGEQEYEHEFKAPYPMLVFNRMGLAIARCRSRYRITMRGIVG